MSSNDSIEDPVDVESYENELDFESLRKSVVTDNKAEGFDFVSPRKSVVNDNKAEEFDFDASFRAPKMDFDSIGEFCFESDILALKCNNDYKNVLEAIVILEAQREQAVKDLKDLKSLKEKALADPFEFLEKLKQEEEVDMPSAQQVYPVPSIDWGKYALSGDPVAFKRRQISRIAADVRKNFKRKCKTAEVDNWSVDEEKHLKELLRKFPSEVDQNARWEKIAVCLENRTASQVSAKVLKSFPHLVGYDSMVLADGHSGKKRKNSELEGELQKKSGIICGSLSDDEDSLDSKIDNSDDEISPDLQETEEYQELLLCKRLLKKRIKSSTLTQHFGFKCKSCKMEPIIGARYHCTECSPSIDLCEECMKNSSEIGQHTTDHQVEEIRHCSAGFLDRDYMHFLGNDYNYLDPNYMPAA